MNFENKGKWQKQIAESKQMNEANLKQNKFSTAKNYITLDNINCGLTIYTTPSKQAMFCSVESEGDQHLFLADVSKINLIDIGDDRRRKLVESVAKDIKASADKFDKDIEAIFAKYGFKKK